MLALGMKTGFMFLLTFVCLLTSAQHTHLPNATISDLAFTNIDFAMNLYRAISSFHDDNIFFSPLSVSTSFAALLMASGGATREEILRGLNLKRLEQADQPDLIPRLFQLLHENISQNGSLKLDQGMAFFVHHSFDIESTFEEQIKKYFSSDIKRVDFSDTQGTLSYINEYVQRMTQDKVIDMLSALDPFARLMLINTIFFQGGWEEPFNPSYTRDAPFYINNYHIVKVPTMLRDDKFYAMEDPALGAKVLKLPYREGVSMLILLPRKNMDYTAIDDEITAERFLGWIKKLQRIRLEVTMPKFKMEQFYPLHVLLPSLGFVSLFSDSANLTMLSKHSNLRVAEVLHKAVIEVDETGTTAAAATTVGITPHSLPRTFNINRPFFFFIYHEETNCLLFMGRVIDPTKF